NSGYFPWSTSIQRKASASTGAIRLFRISHLGAGDADRSFAGPHRKGFIAVAVALLYPFLTGPLVMLSAQEVGEFLLHHLLDNEARSSRHEIAYRELALLDV